MDMGVWCTTRGDSGLAVGGLALGMSIAYFFEVIVGFVLLNKVRKIVTWKKTIRPLFIKLLNSLIMGLGMYFVFKLFDLELDTTRTIQVALLTTGVAVYGCVSYLIGSKVFKIKEFDIGISMIKDFIGKRKKRSE